MGLSPKIYHPFRRRYTLLLGRFRCKKGTGLLGRTARNRAFEAVTGKRLRRVLVEVVLPALKEVGVARLKGGPMTAKLCKMAIWLGTCQTLGGSLLTGWCIPVWRYRGIEQVHTRWPPQREPAVAASERRNGTEALRSRVPKFGQATPSAGARRLPRCL